MFSRTNEYLEERFNALVLRIVDLEQSYQSLSHVHTTRLRVLEKNTERLEEEVEQLKSLVEALKNND